MSKSTHGSCAERGALREKLYFLVARSPRLFPEPLSRALPSGQELPTTHGCGEPKVWLVRVEPRCQRPTHTGFRDLAQKKECKIPYINDVLK